MNVEIDGLAEYMGELVAAAKSDYDAADPGDVGLHGIPIKAWRDAYFEGCKDMAEGIISKLPEQIRQEVGAIVTAAFKKSRAATVQHPTQCAECDCDNPPTACNWIKPAVQQHARKP